MSGADPAASANAAALAAGATAAGCELGDLIADDRGIARYRATEPGLGRACEVVAIDLSRDTGAAALARARTVAARAPVGVQPVHRIEVVDDLALVVAQALTGTSLLAGVRDQSLAHALDYTDQLLAMLEATGSDGVAPSHLADAVVTEHRVTVPCADAVRGTDPTALRSELCAVFALAAERRDIPLRVLSVFEAFDRGVFGDIDHLRRTLRQAQRSWLERHRRLLAIAALLAVVAGTVAVIYAWQRSASIDYIIKDDLPGRVAQMTALAERAPVVPHGRGPNIAGTWIPPDTDRPLPVVLAPTGPAEGGQWHYESGTGTAANQWLHAGTLTLRTTESRYFLTGTLDRTPHIADDDSTIVVEFEVLDAGRMRLRSSVFHDAGGVGWSFAYFDQPLVRPP